MKILVISESLTGNTNSFIEHLEKVYSENISFHLITPTTKEEIKWHDYDKIMIGCYTWSNGKIPIKTKRFVIENRDILLNQDLLIFGSGWSVYENFCGAINGLSIILDHKFPAVKFELRFDPDVEIEALNTFKKFIEKGDNKK